VVDVGAFEHGAGDAGQAESGVVVDDVEDLDVCAVGQRPVGDVGLPALVGLLGFEAEVGALRSLVRLGGDEASVGQDPPDRGHRRRLTGLLFEVERDGGRAGVVAVLVEVLADADDLVLDDVGSAVR
jgi:hypothetical protein